MLATKIDGADYLLEYRVVPKSSIPEKGILGEDLQNYAVIHLGVGQPMVKPSENDDLPMKSGDDDPEVLKRVLRQEKQEVRRMLEELRLEKADVARLIKMLESKKEVTKRLYEAEELKQKKLLQKQEAEATLEPEQTLKVCEEVHTEDFKEMAERKVEVCDESRAGSFEEEAERKLEVCGENRTEKLDRTLEPKQEAAKNEVEKISVGPTAERSEVNLSAPGSDVSNGSETASEVSVAVNRENAVSFSAFAVSNAVV